MSNSVFELLNEDEMFQIRGGAEVPKPISRPRDVFDEETVSVLTRSATTSDQVSPLTFLLNWLKR